jgi:hypothetical protein
VDAVDELGPAARRVLRSRLRTVQSRPAAD